MSFLRNYKISVPAIGAVVVGLAWLAFGYFGVHTLFIDKEVSEAAPTFDLPPAEAETVAAQPGAVAVVPEPPETAVDNEQPADESPADTVAAVPDTTDAADDSQTAAAPEPPTTATIDTEYSGMFESDAHPTSGEAVVLGNGTGQRFLRFENFETDNGPDLNVYLVNSSTGGVSDFVDLGDLKGNIGEQNYEIPAGIDLDVYDEVVIWCVRFGVGFGDALLTAT